MKYITLPDNQTRRLSFYLAMEEYVARHLDEPDCFFLWQVRPTVIFGRHQVLENEVNVGYCQEHGIELYRRKSGGGCVYADMNNVMFSYVVKGETVNLAFNRFINMVVLVLRKMNIEAVGTAHNDVLIGDRKVSGSACYLVDNAAIVHATMLYDTDMGHMTNALTPGPEKLQKKGIESVRQRITLLKDYTSMDIESFKILVRTILCHGERLLTEADIAAIEEIERGYTDVEFINLH